MGCHSGVTYTIKSVTRLLAGALLSAVVVQAAPTSGHWFVRPFASYIGATDKDYSDSAAIGAAIGTTLGAQQSEELAFEASGFHYTISSPYGGSMGWETYLPALFTYRHYFGPASATTRFYLGAGAGFTEVITHLHYSGYGYHVDNTETDFPFTAEGSVGLAVRLSELVTLDVGYRYLHIDSRNVSVAGYVAHTGAFDANTAYAGVAFRF